VSNEFLKEFLSKVSFLTFYVAYSVDRSERFFTVLRLGRKKEGKYQ
jgi:competence transcription factor ComK